MAFSPDDRLLASGCSDHTVKVWNTTTGGLQRTLEGHSTTVWSVAFSLDGRTLSSLSLDHTIKAWDTATGALQQTLRGHSHSFSTGNYTSSLSQSNAEIFILEYQWVAVHGQKVLWLPPEYRPICSAVKDGTLVLGCASGCVSFVIFGVGLNEKD